MPRIRVAVHGAAGRMGQEVVKAVARDPELELVGAVEKKPSQSYLLLQDGSTSVPYLSDVREAISTCRPDVMVDFSLAEASMSAARVALMLKVGMVIGTTGLSDGDIAQISDLANSSAVGVVVAPNFALGAVLMMHFARVAARHFDFAEITELHHIDKADAPSGTALATARSMVAARQRSFSQANVSRQTLSGSRGANIDGIAIHSVRLPGLMAHQEVLLGAAGQTLAIRHDTISRECFMPGVIMAVKKVLHLRGLVMGLEHLLGLQEDQ